MQRNTIKRQSNIYINGNKITNQVVNNGRPISEQSDGWRAENGRCNKNGRLKLRICRKSATIFWNVMNIKLHEIYTLIHRFGIYESISYKSKNIFYITPFVVESEHRSSSKHETCYFTFCTFEDCAIQCNNEQS